MSDPASSVLKRKTSLGRVQPDHGLISPAKALRLGVSKAAQDVLKVPFAAGEISETRITVEDFAEFLNDGSLSLLLHGPGTGRGLVSLDAGALSAVIQAQTLGRIMSFPVHPRVPTATDAMLARKFFGAFLTAFTGALADHPSSQWADGFSIRDRLEDVRRLPHLLKDVAYRIYVISLDIGGGAHNGRICLALPHERGVEDDDHGATIYNGETEWRSALGNLVLESPAQLEAVLYRFRFTLSDVAAMRPGDVLALPGRALGNVSVEGESGEQTGTARLGQVEGRRAIKLTGGELSSRHTDPATAEFQSAAPKSGAVQEPARIETTTAEGAPNGPDIEKA